MMPSHRLTGVRCGGLSVGRIRRPARNRSFQVGALAVAVIAITVFTLAGCGGCGRGDDQELGEIRPDRTRVPARVVTVTADSISERLQLVGRLQPCPDGSALLTAPEAGFVRSVPVQLGQHVALGQALLVLSAPDVEARAQALAAAAEVATKDAQRQQELVQRGIASRKKADEAQSAAVAAQAEAQAAAEALARLTVRSPLRGVVQRVGVQRGERVEAGASLAEVVNADTLDFVAPVPDGQPTPPASGAPALISTPLVAAGRWGRVIASAPSVDSATNATTLVVRVANPEGTLHPGAGATALVTLATHHGVAVIPEAALVGREDSFAVFVMAPDSTVHERAVQLGFRSGGRAEVVTGLQPGELIVTTGAYGLAEGMRVNPQTTDLP